MAIYHFSVRMISRGKGMAVLATASYRSGTKLFDERLGCTHNNTRRKGVIHEEILSPEDCPEWALERESLWNMVEATETRRNSQTAREILVALPVELSREQQLDLVRGFARDVFVEAGMVADVTITCAKEHNPNACILLTTREIKEGSFVRRKNLKWNGRSALFGWRKSWADHCNAALERAGIDARVDHRSHAERNIELEPVKRLNVPSDAVFDPNHDRLKVDTRDATRDAIAAQKEAMKRNSRRVLERPDMALSAMGMSAGNIDETELTAWLRTRVDPDELTDCVNSCLAFQSSRA